MIEGLKAYWLGALQGDPTMERLGLDLIGIVLACRAERLMIASNGADGAA